jgi:hypothetical protein
MRIKTGTRGNARFLPMAHLSQKGPTEPREAEWGKVTGADMDPVTK